MKRLLNTLYVMTEDAYASLENDNVVLSVKGKKIGQYPAADAGKNCAVY